MDTKGASVFVFDANKATCRGNKIKGMGESEYGIVIGEGEREPFGEAFVVEEANSTVCVFPLHEQYVVEACMVCIVVKMVAEISKEARA